MSKRKPMTDEVKAMLREKKKDKPLVARKLHLADVAMAFDTLTERGHCFKKNLKLSHLCTLRHCGPVVEGHFQSFLPHTWATFSVGPNMTRKTPCFDENDARAILAAIGLDISKYTKRVKLSHDYDVDPAIHYEQFPPLGIPTKLEE